MTLRNKFMHLIDCNSFGAVLAQLDKTHLNKFRKFLSEGEDEYDEEACKSACKKLYIDNLRFLRDKFTERRLMIENQSEFLKYALEIAENYSDAFHGLINDVYLILENSKLECEEIRDLSMTISEKCQEYAKKFLNEEGNISFVGKLNEYLHDKNVLKQFHGITREKKEINEQHRGIRFK